MQAFALFRLPHEDKIYFIKGQISLDLEVLDFGTLQSCFVISPFAQKNRAFIIMPDEMNEWQGESFDLFYHQDSQESGTESQYIHYVNHAIETLTTHLDIHKFVSARVKNLSKPDTFNVFDLFRNLSQNYPSAFTYLVSSEITGTWIGASPELLLHHQTDTIKTVALAGTLSNDNTNSWTEKEITEQKWVEDFIIDTLKPFSENYTQSNAETIVSGNLKHLKTEFSLTINNSCNKVSDVLQKLNPTPAVCGLPQDIAYHYILDHEGFERQFYSGFVGVVNHNCQSHLYVNIRCAQVFDKQINLYAGAGITLSSIPEKEWIETENKMEAIGRFILPNGRH